MESCHFANQAAVCGSEQPTPKSGRSPSIAALKAGIEAVVEHPKDVDIAVHSRFQI